MEDTTIHEAVKAEREETLGLLRAAMFRDPQSDIAKGINGTLAELARMIQQRPNPLPSKAGSKGA